MAVTIPDKALFRIDEVAALCGVHPDTVRRWAKEGRLATITLPKGRIRVARAALAALLSAEPAGEGEGSIKWLGRGS
jgi:excisionase family DNA binding protein